MEYFQVRFRAEPAPLTWPVAFAVITAYATTGVRWSPDENARADQRLESDLRARTRWLCRVTGYSPQTGHAEPGWAVTLSPEEACRVGQHFLQHAIFVVQEDTLRVLNCSDGTGAEIGSFRGRLDPP